jgi:HK97 family phage major capsid protein
MRQRRNLRVRGRRDHPINTGADLFGASAHDPDHRHRRTPPDPEQVEDLLVLPVLAQSVALNPLVSTVVRLNGSTYRIPRVTADPSAAWVAEGAEIPASDLTTNELVVTPSKVAGPSVITSELAEDSSPEASTEVGVGLARDIARKVDAAFFGDAAANTPSGLRSLTVGAGNVQDIAAGTAPTNLDGFASAQMLAGNVGAEITSFVTNPTTALILANMKEATGSASRCWRRTPPSRPAG